MLLLFFLFFGMDSSVSHADWKDHVFYPHLTTTARTAGPWGLTFETFPGANGLQTFLVDSLALGIGERFQVGIVPLFFLVPGHEFNLNLKWNFLNFEKLQFGIGVTQFWMHAEANPNVKYEANYVVLAVDYFTPIDWLALGFNYNVVTVKSSDGPTQAILETRPVPSEWFVDVAFRVAKSWAITPGFGTRRTDTFDVLNASTPISYGLSFTWIRGTKWFPTIRLGANYIPTLERWDVLFTFSI